MTPPPALAPSVIRRAPKVLLHDHLDGGLRPQTIIDLAAEIGYERLPAQDAAALGKWFVIWSPIPWPKGKIKAPPAFFWTPPGPELEADRERLLEYVRRFGKPEEISWGTSPFLGKLDAREWAALNARHLEHHLSQFGV